jgi:hypothetical protein
MSTDNQNASADAQAKITTLFGGTTLTVTYEDGSAGSIRVRQLRISEYEKALPLMGDEISITAFCCSLETTPAVPCKKEWGMTLHPQSYELVQAKVQEVNAGGFFTYAARKEKDEQRVQALQMSTFAALPAEIQKAALEAGRSALLSATPSPRPRAIPR